MSMRAGMQPYRIRYARADSGDGGAGFSATDVVPGTTDVDEGFNGGLQGLFMRKLAVDADGRITVINSRYRDGEASRVRLYRGRLSP